MSLLTDEERGSVEDVAAAVRIALDTFQALRRQAPLVALLQGSRCHYEVPFSFHEPESGCILRGSIDCLIERPDGSVVVLELKTGVRSPVHDRQLSIYVQAVRRLFPSANVEGLLVYP
jgi:ATP-dependent exoDNAse (exonuclease V) beta subunit